MPSTNEIIVRTIVEFVKQDMGMREPGRGDHGLTQAADDAIFYTEIFVTLNATAQKAWVDKMEERWNWKRRGDGDKVTWGNVVGFDYNKPLAHDRTRVLSTEEWISEDNTMMMGRLLVEFNPEAWKAYVVWKHYENLYETAHPRLSDAEVSSIHSGSDSDRK